MSQRTDGEEEPDDSGLQDGVVTAERGPNRDQMAADYLPEANHWAAKTQLDPHDPGAIGGLRQFGNMFPEVEDLQPVIDGVLAEFFPAKTSVQGKSREEYRNIIMSMYGGQGTVEEASAFMKALGAADEDD